MECGEQGNQSLQLRRGKWGLRIQMDREEASKDPNVLRESRSSVARRIYQERRIRSEHFADNEVFGEPAWDILLYLFQGHSRGRGVKIQDVSWEAGLPATSALRWFELLESKGLVFAYRDEEHLDQIYLRLSRKGLLEMASYLDRVAQRRSSGAD